MDFKCECGCSQFHLLTSMNIKICINCKKEYPWHLDDGQKSLISNNRADRSYPNTDYFDEDRMDIIGQNGNDGEHYMCGDRWLETGRPWKE